MSKIKSKNLKNFNLNFPSKNNLNISSKIKSFKNQIYSSQKKNLTSQTIKEKFLVIDLDETLIHTSTTSTNLLNLYQIIIIFFYLLLLLKNMQFQ